MRTMMAIISIVTFVGISSALAFNTRPIDISLNNKDNSICLNTDIRRFTLNEKPFENVNINYTIDLFSTVHIGDKEYYETLNYRMKNYDIVLYELITNQDNINTDLSRGRAFKSRLKEVVYSRQTEGLAAQFGFSNQLDLNLKQKNWYIADLDIETIREMESKNTLSLQKQFWLSQIGGRTFSQKLLRNFFIDDKFFITVLRIVSWLTPCPELGCLLIDWSRMMPNAGGFSPILIPILQHILQGNFQAASKLSFAQQLLSGLPDSGAWGGEALSDIPIRVLARNQECVRVLSGFLDEHTEFVQGKIKNEVCGSLEKALYRQNSVLISKKNNDEDPVTDSVETNPVDEELKIAVLYGAYHINDLTKRFINDIGLTPKPSDSPVNSQITAWTVPNATKKPISTQLASELEGSLKSNMEKRHNLTLGVGFEGLSPNTAVTLVSCFMGYLIVGALDWWVLVDLFARTLELLTKHDNNISIISNSLLSGVITNMCKYEDCLDVGKNTAEQTYDTLSYMFLSISYFILYIQRHSFLLKKISYVGIQWDRGLFSDVDKGFTDK